MSNSPLVRSTLLSPNHSGPRGRAIDRITPHCVVGQLSAEGICGLFVGPNKEKASCNYAIGTDGEVGLCVDEGNISWCSSSPPNDRRAVTIECASDMTNPYAMNEAVYNSLVALCVDICQRNGKTRLLWLGDKSKTLAYKPKANEMVLTVHRWFANKSCPGPWLYDRLGELANIVTARIGLAHEPVPEPGPVAEQWYRVRKSWPDAASQIGAYKVLANAKAACKPGYAVFDENGREVYTNRKNSVEGSLESFVRAVQRAIGAAVDGIAGPETLGKTPTVSATKNNRHGVVRAVQERLNALGYTQVGPADGIAGPKFTAAVQAFQRDNGCVADGELTAHNKTWRKLLGME